jgi:uncharacterized alkaline shock family protein YloU
VAEETLSIDAPQGRISYSRDAVAQIVAHVVAESYGVVGIAPSGPIARLSRRDTRGVELGGDGAGLRIDVYVVVEYGLNLAEVASTVRNRISYEVERLTGLKVAAVEVHIQDVRRSA